MKILPIKITLVCNVGDEQEADEVVDRIQRPLEDVGIDVKSILVADVGETVEVSEPEPEDEEES